MMKSFVTIILAASAFAAKIKQVGTDANSDFYGDVTVLDDSTADVYYETYEFSNEDSYADYSFSDMDDAVVTYDSYYSDSNFYGEQIFDNTIAYV